MALPFFLSTEPKQPAEDRLRALIADGKNRLVPELADCMGAKAAEMNGYEVIMISSGDLACAMTGIPDLQLLSVDDFCRVTEQITRMTPMPLISIKCRMVAGDSPISMLSATLTMSTRSSATS